MRRKQALICGGAVAVSGVLLSSYAGILVGALAMRSAMDRGRATARQLAYNSTYGVVTGNRSLLDQLAEGALDMADVDLVELTIRDTRGQALAQRSRAAAASPVVITEASRAAGGAGGSVAVVVDVAPARSAGVRAAVTMLGCTAVLAFVLGLVAGAIAGPAEFEAGRITTG